MDVNLGQASAAVGLALGLAVVLFVPGLVALETCRHPSRGWDRLGLALGASVALWPVFYLWAAVLGIDVGQRGVRAAALAATLAIAAVLLARARARGRPAPSAAGLGLGAVLALSIALRVAHARDLVAAPWVDGYHHTLITELFLERGGLPADWRPYLPVDRFYYHFGFHAIAAVVSQLTGAGAALATLWTGQALNALVPLAVYSLLLRFTRSQAAAVAGAIVPVSLYYFPAYFASWARYTQLAGLVVLPASWVLLADGVAGADSRASGGRAVRAGPRRRPAATAVDPLPCGTIDGTSTDREASDGPPDSDRVGALRAASWCALAALLAAGLFLVHVRVFAFYALGVLLLASYAAVPANGRRRALVVLVAVACSSALIVAPWLARALAPAVAERAAASGAWYRAAPEVTDVPAWLFSIGLNRALLILAALGLALGLVARRLAAWATAAWLALAATVVNAHRFGLPPMSFLPPFALAISAFVPVSAGIAIGTDVLLAALSGRLHGAGRAAERVVVVAALGVAIWGASRMRAVVNPATVIARPADVAAAAWIRGATPTDACFLVTAGAWQLGTFRGLDGGYWLPLLAGRATTMPASFYNHGDRAYALAVRRVAETAARGDALSDDDLLALVRDTGATHVYIGPASDGAREAFTAARIAGLPGFETVYEREGVTVLEAPAPSRLSRSEAAGRLCAPIVSATGSSGHSGGRPR